jgi:hypothetical protein
MWPRLPVSEVTVGEELLVGVSLLVLSRGLRVRTVVVKSILPSVEGALLARAV